MPLPEILAAIDHEVASRTSSIEAEARERCDALMASAAERADSERLRLAHARDEAAALAAARIVNQARLAADRALRAAQEELFERAVDQARTRLASLRTTPSYEQVFADLLVEAHRALPDAGTVRIDPRDEAIVETALERLEVSLAIDTSLSSWGGMQLVTDDGRLVENTLESRLYKADPALRRLSVSICPELTKAIG